MDDGRNERRDLGPLPNSQTPDTPGREADVIVVGAGLAGLAAARAVLRAGLEPIVVEARGRIGGRVVNEPIADGKIVEMGGQWVAPRSSGLRRFAAEVGIEFFPTYETGSKLMESSGKVRQWKGKLPPLRIPALLDVGLARLRLDRLAHSVPAHAPWTAPRAQELDAQTLGSWFDQTVRSREGRALLDAAATTIWGAAPDRINLLQALAYTSGAGNFEALTTRELQDRIVGGSARLADVLAAELGHRIVLRHPVERIENRSGRVEVIASGVAFTAQRAIVAVPPQLAARIEFDPWLPERRALALRCLPMARVTKVAAVYDRPFWRERGLCGQAITLSGPVTAVFDNSPPDGDPGVLIGFVPGERAKTLAARPEAERRLAVLETFSRLFGTEAAEPRAFFEKDWAADPWTRGCYFGLATASSLTGVLRTLAEPVGGVHWAGAETATENYGGMDGALASGERAAAEVLAELPQTAVRPG